MSIAGMLVQTFIVLGCIIIGIAIGAVLSDDEE